MVKILLIEDDLSIAESVCKGLKYAGYYCDHVMNGEDGANAVDKKNYDIILLDIMLPGVDGFELMRYISPRNISVIFLTAKSAVSDKVHGLKLGADDYITKPFEIIELLARIEAVLRRRNIGITEISYGDVLVNTLEHSVTLRGAPVHLKMREYNLVLFLLRNQGIALYRETIYEHVWEQEYTGDTRTIDLHIMRIRKKLRWENQLETISRIGYRLKRSI